MKHPRSSYKRGFARAATLMQRNIRKAGETRGFAETRVLTHWEEIVGSDLARIARPVDVSYGRGGIGATLTVLTTGAQAPMLDMQKESLRAKVNACYGYNAIARLRITQTAPTGFAEGQIAFQHAPKKTRRTAPAAQDAAQKLAADVGDDALRVALAALGANVITKRPDKT